MVIFLQISPIILPLHVIIRTYFLTDVVKITFKQEMKQTGCHHVNVPLLFITCGVTVRAFPHFQ